MRDYFRFYKLNLKKECPFWADDSKCAMRTCHVSTCEEKDIPEGLKGYHQQESFLFKVMAKNVWFWVNKRPEKMPILLENICSLLPDRIRYEVPMCVFPVIKLLLSFHVLCLFFPVPYSRGSRHLLQLQYHFNLMDNIKYVSLLLSHLQVYSVRVFVYYMFVRHKILWRTDFTGNVNTSERDYIRNLFWHFCMGAKMYFAAA